MHRRCFLLIFLLHWNTKIAEENIILNNIWNVLDSCEEAFNVFRKFNSLVASQEVYYPISRATTLNNLK